MRGPLSILDLPWGCDHPTRLFIMGLSADAQLAALICTDDQIGEPRSSRGQPPPPPPDGGSACPGSGQAPASFSRGGPPTSTRYSEKRQPVARASKFGVIHSARRHPG